MRTFRFNSGSTRTDTQQQTVECHLHLEPTDDNQEQGTDCSCYTIEECQDRCQGYF